MLRSARTMTKCLRQHQAVVPGMEVLLTGVVNVAESSLHPFREGTRLGRCSTHHHKLSSLPYLCSFHGVAPIKLHLCFMSKPCI